MRSLRPIGATMQTCQMFRRCWHLPPGWDMTPMICLSERNPNMWPPSMRLTARRPSKPVCLAHQHMFWMERFFMGRIGLNFWNARLCGPLIRHAGRTRRRNDMTDKVSC